jgi:hypothetical protein
MEDPMLVIAISRNHKIGDTADVRINFEPATLTWADAHTLVINGTDRRRILRTDEGTDSTGRPCWSFLAGDSEIDIRSGEAPSELTVVTPDTVRTFRQTIE